MFVELLLAEIRLREQMQLEEHLQATESRSLQSKASNNGTEPPQYNEKLEQVRKQIGFYMLDLYRYESILPLRSLRQVYDKLRKILNGFSAKILSMIVYGKEVAVPGVVGAARNAIWGTRQEKESDIVLLSVDAASSIADANLLRKKRRNWRTRR